MILTTHILSGAALGANVKNPYAVAGLAVILHFLLDLFPHGDYLNKKSRLREFWKVGIDLFLGFSLVILTISFKKIFDPLVLQNIFIGITFSLLPDFTTFLHNWMKMKFLAPVRAFHEGIHRYENGSPQREFRLRNNLWDLMISAMSLVILFLI